MIEIREVSKRYHGGREEIVALNNVSLTIKSGDFVAIVGPAGSGKSTLMNIVAGYYTPTTGKIIVDGESLNKFGNVKMALYRYKNIGIVNGSEKNNSFGYILRMARFKFFLSFLYKRIKSGNYEEVFKKLNLDELKGKKKSEMTLEEKERVAIGRALANNPKVILVDKMPESLCGRDSERIMSILEEINKEGVTIIMVTENPVEANRARRVIKIIDGDVVSDIIKE
ncbi:MAG: ABC transporter ATP-binding protein [Clostridium sp.]